MEVGHDIVCHLESRVDNRFQDAGVGGLHVVEETLFEILDVFDGDAIAVSLDTDEKGAFIHKK